jgi:CTP synthase
MEQRDENSDKGGTMRLGAYPCALEDNTRAFEAYNKTEISERHRHRYEFNNAYLNILKEKGLVISGMSPEKDLVEIVEVSDHPWFLGCQFHPEFKSRPMDCHPLFRDFIKSSYKFKKSKK